MIRVFVLASIILSAAQPAKTYAQNAEMEWLRGKALRKAFSGKTMDGIYKQPRRRTGTNRFSETFHDNGQTDYKEGSVTDKGRWNVQDGIICFHYAGALSGNISCFAVYRSGTCFYSYAPSKIGTENMPRNLNSWSAKTIYHGDVSTCNDLIS